jgi:DNA repair protein RecO (recombination protein O)
VTTELSGVYVLHTRPYRDTSLLVELFSRSQGRFAAVARGARAGRRRGGTRLQVFAPLAVSVTGRSSLKTLGQIEADGRAWPLQGRALFSGLYVNELLHRLLHHDDPHPTLFDAYLGALARLSGSDDTEPALRSFEWQLLAELGYGFALDRCGDSGDALLATATYRFDAEAGLVPARGGDPADRCFSGGVLLDLAAGSLDGAARQAAKRLSRLALRPLLGDRPLASRALFQGSGEPRR